MFHIPLIKPYITEEVQAKVREVLTSGYITEGKVTEELQDAFKSYIGCKHAIAVTSCTTGLEIALRALGVGPGDEVIVPDYTHPATADVVAIVGATIVLVDVSLKTMLIAYDAIEDAITSRTRVVMPVSLFGNPLDYERLAAIKERYGIYIVEDAACALGAEFKEKKVGNHADISVFSLHPRKFITTGEGGMVVTLNDGWAEWMNSYKHFGMHALTSAAISEFVRIGTNYKLSNLLAAIGLVQMRHAGELLSKRVALAENYGRLLKPWGRVAISETTSGGRHSYQSYVIAVERRDEIMKKMREQGIEVQIGTYALHAQPAFQSYTRCRVSGEMAGSRQAFERCLTLPLYHDMKEEEQELVVASLLALL